MTKATLLVCAGLLLCAIPAAAVVPCNLYVRSSDGNDGDNGSTWALAKATLAGAVTAWTDGDVICVEDNRAERTATGQT